MFNVESVIPFHVSLSSFQNAESEHQLAEGESLTDYKMKMLGTPDDVRNSFQMELANQQRLHGQGKHLTARSEVVETDFLFPDVFHRIRQNINRTKVEAMCRWPSKKVLTMPQQPSKTYLPHRYVIYRCSDDTACCGSSDKTCVAKKTEEVVLWFHVRLAVSFLVLRLPRPELGHQAKL